MDPLVQQCAHFIGTHLEALPELWEDLAVLPGDLFSQLARVCLASNRSFFCVFSGKAAAFA
jgi:hypothetical protein